MADRSVASTDTFAVWRNTYNSTATDIGDIGTLGDVFTGTPTDLVEACNARAGQGSVLAMAIALGGGLAPATFAGGAIQT